MAAPPTVRFAPSPTGFIHIGNARTALINWLYALRAGGRFILRFDDTDLERSRREYADAIEADLAWLGIVPDLTCRQSERMALYEAAAEKLKRAGRLYPGLRDGRGARPPAQAPAGARPPADLGGDAAAEDGGGDRHRQNQSEGDAAGDGLDRALAHAAALLAPVFGRRGRETPTLQVKPADAPLWRDNAATSWPASAGAPGL